MMITEPLKRQMVKQAIRYLIFERIFFIHILRSSKLSFQFEIHRAFEIPPSKTEPKKMEDFSLELIVRGIEDKVFRRVQLELPCFENCEISLLPGGIVIKVYESRLINSSHFLSLFLFARLICIGERIQIN